MGNFNLFLKEISKPLHQEAYNKVDLLQIDLQKAIDANTDCQSERLKLEKDIGLLKIASNIVKDSPVDTWLKMRFGDKETKPIAYKGKRTVTIKQDKVNKEKSGTYTVFLNEMITPDAFEVQKYKKLFLPNTRYNMFVQIAKDFTQRNTWVSEPDLYKGGDFYLQPSEALTFMIDCMDCDDCANTIASLDADYCGCIIGKYINNPQDQQDFFWHAYPFFIDEQGNAFIVETTMKEGKVFRFDDSHFEHHIIYTKTKTFQLRDTKFGYLDYI